jgi:hypothetical protein
MGAIGEPSLAPFHATQPISIPTSLLSRFIGFVHGQMGLVNAQRTLNYVRTLAQFISQPEYRDVVTMFGILNEPFIPFVLFFLAVIFVRAVRIDLSSHPNPQHDRGCSCRSLVYRSLQSCPRDHWPRRGQGSLDRSSFVHSSSPFPFRPNLRR